MEVIADPDDRVTVDGVEYTTFYVALGNARADQVAHQLEVDYCRNCGELTYCSKHEKVARELY